MEPTENNVTELELTEASYFAEQLDRLERLEKNPDFQKLILDGYVKQKALDSVSLLAHPAIKTRGERPDIMEDLVSISNFSYYLQMIRQLGEGARADLFEDEGPTAEA